MEAIADRAVRALQRNKWDRTTVISVRSNAKGDALFVGANDATQEHKNDSAQRKAADWALGGSAKYPKPDGVPKDINKYCDLLRQRDHSARAFADLTAYAARDGRLVDGGVELPGDAAVFTASNVEDKDVSLALLEDGSAEKSGRLQLLVPVWCSVLKCMITMRLFLGRKSVDSVSEPSLEQTTDTRDAVMRLKNFEGSKTALQNAKNPPQTDAPTGTFNRGSRFLTQEFRKYRSRKIARPTCAFSRQKERILLHYIMKLELLMLYLCLMEQH